MRVGGKNVSERVTEEKWKEGLEEGLEEGWEVEGVEETTWSGDEKWGSERAGDERASVGGQRLLYPSPLAHNDSGKPSCRPF